MTAQLEEVSSLEEKEVAVIVLSRRGNMNRSIEEVKEELKEKFANPFKDWKVEAIHVART